MKRREFLRGAPAAAAVAVVPALAVAAEPTAMFISDDNAAFKALVRGETITWWDHDENDVARVIDVARVPYGMKG